MSTTMTPEDLEAAQPFADKIVAMIHGMRPPAAVAGCALALAAIAHLAECGSGAARHMFEGYYETLGKAMKQAIR